MAEFGEAPAKRRFFFSRLLTLSLGKLGSFVGGFPTKKDFGLGKPREWGLRSSKSSHSFSTSAVETASSGSKNPNAFFLGPKSSQIVRLASEPWRKWIKRDLLKKGRYLFGG